LSIAFRLSVMVSRLRAYPYPSSMSCFTGLSLVSRKTILHHSIINSILFSPVLLFHVRAHVYKVSACCNTLALCLQTHVIQMYSIACSI
ncbi:hypothetical protein K438DRAFT_1887742, partial [Mycena galopus ATCC 62051]